MNDKEHIAALEAENERLKRALKVAVEMLDLEGPTDVIDVLANAKEENEWLKSRLEWREDGLDGIVCRDATIRLLEEQRNEARQQLEAFKRLADGDAYQALMGNFEAVTQQLDIAVELYEQALKASWPNGAMGDAFDYWNSARATIRELKREVV